MLSRFFVNRPIFAWVIAITIMLAGVLAIFNLPVSQYPNIAPPQVRITATYPGASAETMSRTVTQVIEQNMTGLDGLIYMSSNSDSTGRMTITLTFVAGTNPDIAQVQVQNKLSMAEPTLPDTVRQLGVQVQKSSASFLQVVGFIDTSGKLTSGDLGDFLTNNIEEPLARLEGVGEVTVFGASYAMRIWMDPALLVKYGLEVSDVMSAISTQNVQVASGDIAGQPTNGKRMITATIRASSLLTTPEQFEQIALKTLSDGSVVRIKDIGEVSLGQETYTFQGRYDGQPSSGVAISLSSGANALATAARVQAKLDELRPFFPEGVEAVIPFDTTPFVRAAMHEVVKTLLEAIVLVVCVMFLFLQNWRATIIPTISVPVVLLGTFAVLALMGYSINMLTMFALVLAIGLLVDDAIVVLENVTTHIERGSEPKQAAIHATNEVAISVIASTLTMIAVFFPLTMVSGMSGVLFRQLGWMMCVIMTVSTVSALSFTPMMCAQLLRLQKKQSKMFLTLYTPIQRALDGLDVWYQNRLNWAVRHRLTVMAGCAAFFVASLFCAKYIGTEFFPAADNSRIGINLQLPIGARVERAEALASELTNKWMTRYGDMMKVCNYTVGQADSDNTFASMQDNGSHIISFNISLVSPGDRDVTLETVCDEMREDLKGYPELDKAQVILGGSTGGMSAQASADFEVYGYDFTATDKVSAELKEKLLQVKGVSEVNISRQDYQPEYQVDFDREKLALHGLNLSTASNYLRNRVNGALASYYREDGDEYDIRVRYAPEFRTKIEDLENILIYTPSGDGVRIKDLGKVVERSAPPTIERKDRERVVTVSAVISGVPLGDVVADGNAIIDKMDLPSGISIQISGSYEDQQDSFSDLGTLAVLIVILVFIVMAAQFESLSYPFIIMFSIPFAFSGVLMALFFTGTNLNVMSLLGGIMLIGIVVKNGIVLIDYITLCRERGQAVLHSVVTAGRSRLRPVLMTTLTTILGMVPMAVGQGEGAEMWRPLGVAVIGGLTVSTILTLILVPVLYCSFAGVGIRRTRKKIKKDRELNDYYQLHKEKMTKPRKQ